MRKLTFISAILVVSALLILPSFSVLAEDDEGVPWFGLLPYLLTGGPPTGEPKAVFSVDPTSGQVPLTVDFNASSSADPDGTIESYEWDFDDGNSRTGEQVTHTYNSAGNYTPELMVTDDDRKTDSYSNFTISVTSTNELLNASFTADPTSGEVPLEVFFDASNSSDPDGSIDSYTWDFDDGSTGTGETVNHTFDSSGDYTVELYVTDDDGATDSTTTQIEVTSPSPTEIPTDMYVDVNNGSDESGDGSQNNPYKTITKAVSMADISSTHNNIYLESGVYTSSSGENFPLTLDKIDLIGNPDYPSQVEVSGKITVSNGEVIGIHFYQTLTADEDALIQKNRFTGIGNQAVYIFDTSTIKDNTFENNGTAIRGYVLIDNGPVEISNNTFVENNGYAITGEFEVKDVLIDSNQIEASGSGIDICLSSRENYEAVIRNNDISVEYHSIELSLHHEGEVLIEENDASGREILIRGGSSATIDMGGGSLGSSGNNVFKQTESSGYYGDYYLVSHELPAYSGTIYAKNNTWKDSSGNEIQPPDVLKGPADTGHFYIENKGNKIIFSE